jgi:DNA modification methylase
MAWFAAAGNGCTPWGFSTWQPVLCFGKDPYLAKGLGSRPDSLSKIEASDKVDHPCSKPVGVWSWFIERCSVNLGDLLFEPFSGSGTTIIAAEQTGRRCYAMELSPQYIDVAVRRWQQFTGKVATLEATGEPFPQDQPACAA